MKAVANSSVLIALSMIGRLDLLSRRFPEGILIPQSVWQEVVEKGKGQPGARRLGLPVLGTVGVLIWAKRAGLVANLQEHLDALQTQGKFRLSQSVYERALRAASEAKQ